MYSTIGDFLGSSDGKASAYNEGAWVQSLGQEDLLEKEMATHSSTLAWKIHGWRSHATAHGVAKSRTRLSNFTFTFTWSLKVFHCTLLADVVNCPQQIICVPKSSPLVEPRRVTTYPGFVRIVNAFCTSLIINGCCCLVTKSYSTLLRPHGL